MRSFEIFNPETDDMDSDNESTTTLSSGDDDRSSNGSVESVVSVVKEEDLASLAPPTLVITEVEDELPGSDEESYIPVGAMQIVEEKEKAAAAAALKEEQEKSKEEMEEKEEVCTDDDSGMASAELRRRAEVRAKLLSFFLEENKSLLGNIVSGGGARRSRAPVGTASSVESGAETDVDKSKSELIVERKNSRPVHAKIKADEDKDAQKKQQQEQQQHKAASLPSSSTNKTAKPAMPKKSPDGHESPAASRASPSPPIYTGTQHPLSLPPGALAVPSPARSPRRRLDKARSVSPGRHAPAAGTPPVVRQSSVPSRFDEVYIKPTTEMEIRTRRTLMSAGEGATTTTASGDVRKITLAHLDVAAGGDLSGATTTTQSSRESLISISTDGGTGSLSKSKSPSPSRSDASHISSSNTSSSGGRKTTSAATGAIPKKPLSRQASLQREEATGRIRRVSGSSASTPPRRRRQLPPLPTEAQSSSTSDLRRRPSMEDLAQTESLIPTHGPDDGGESGEPGNEQQFSVSKLRELDPRFDRAATSSAASGGIASTSAAASDTESICSFPYRYADRDSSTKSPISTDANKSKPIIRRLERKKASGGGREDSLESTSTSAKSSVQYSDTSSLLSHRFSTVSISSNVSSDVSFGGASAGGSSCYLASMSSADFDDGPPSTIGSNRAAVLASSFSLSEADENEYLSQQQQQQEQQQQQQQRPQPQMPPQVPRTPQERLRMKTLFRRGRETSSSSAKDLRQQQQQQQQQQQPELPQPRSRIGTETSADSVEHVTCIDRSSFEDSEAFVGEDVLASGNVAAAVGSGNNPNSANLARQASVSTTSDSASDSGGSLTHHRYKEYLV